MPFVPAFNRRKRDITVEAENPSAGNGHGTFAFRYLTISHCGNSRCARSASESCNGRKIRRSVVAGEAFTNYSNWMWSTLSYGAKIPGSRQPAPTGHRS
jgi:hypothetical protein